MTKNDGYREITNIEALGDLPGANRAKDLLRISLVDQNHTLATALAAALASDGSDSLLVDPATGSTFTVTIDTDNAGLATETTLSDLADALASNGSDTLQVDQQGVLDVSSRDGRNLGDVDVTSLPAIDITNDDARDLGDVDVTGTVDIGDRDTRNLGDVDVTGTVDIGDRAGRDLGAVDVTEVPDHDEAFRNGASLASGNTLSDSLAAPGADSLEGRVVRATTSYDVTIEWLDAAGGNVLFTTSVASGVAAGTETSISETAQSPYCTVKVSDAGSGSGGVTATYNLS